MPAHQKINGAWTAIAQPWVKDGAVWKQVQVGTQNVDGEDRIWHVTDAVPPASPVLSAEFDESDKALYVVVGVKLPGATHDPDLKRIRVLVSMGTDVYPANPLSSGYYEAPATAGGKEPWSDWYYNNLGIGSDGLVIQDNRSSAVFSNKKFAPTYKVGDQLPRNKRINFRAWAQDKAGNWSPPTNVFLITPKSGAAADDDYSRAALILPQRVGTIRRNADTITDGEGKVHWVNDGERYYTYFDYGDQVQRIITNSASISYAHVRLSRAAEFGAPVAKQRAGRFDVLTAAKMSSLDEAQWMYNAGDSSTLNAISLGQTVSKKIPSDWFNNFNTNFRGFALYSASGDRPGTQALYKSQAQDPNQGALLIRWREDD